MDLERLSEEWWFGLCRTAAVKDEVDWSPIRYEDCTIYPIRSIELGRTYSCYHVVGSDMDFILKESDENEAEVYKNLNHYKIIPRLRVPKMYKSLKITNRSTNRSIIYIVLEHIKVKDGFGSTGCEDQVDGLLMYEEGQSAEAWESAGYELARICCSFWNISPLDGIPYNGKSYEVLKSRIGSSHRIQTNKDLKAAFEKSTKRLDSMARCLQNLDLLPINVLIKERSFSSNGKTVVHPNAYIIDWKNAFPAPYILDLARIVSHCYRDIEVDENVQMYSKSYCSDMCREAVINGFANKLRKQKPNITATDSEIDLLCGVFFETARMFIQMPYDIPQNSYDRFYCHNISRLADQILSEF